MKRGTEPDDLTTLSAYLDGELDEERRAAVERRIAGDPEAARRVDAYRRRDAALRVAFAEFGAAQQKRPASRVGRSTAGRRHAFRVAVAAAVLCCTLGPAGWWYGRMLIEDNAPSTLVREAMTAHALYASRPGQEPFVPADRSDVSARLSALLGTEVKAPDLSALGFRLVDLRELAADKGPAILLVYQDAAGRHVSCYFERLSDDRETGFVHSSAGETSIIYRLDERLGYAVVGTLPVTTLEKIASAGYQEISSSKP